MTNVTVERYNDMWKNLYILKFKIISDTWKNSENRKFGNVRHSVFGDLCRFKTDRSTIFTVVNFINTKNPFALPFSVLIFRRRIRRRKIQMMKHRKAIIVTVVIIRNLEI